MCLNNYRIFKNIEVYEYNGTSFNKSSNQRATKIWPCYWGGRMKFKGVL